MSLTRWPVCEPDFSPFPRAPGSESAVAGGPPEPGPPFPGTCLAQSSDGALHPAEQMTGNADTSRIQRLLWSQTPQDGRVQTHSLASVPHAARWPQPRPQRTSRHSLFPLPRAVSRASFRSLVLVACLLRVGLLSSWGWREPPTTAFSEQRDE